MANTKGRGCNEDKGVEGKATDVVSAKIAKSGHAREDGSKSSMAGIGSCGEDDSNKESNVRDIRRCDGPHPRNEC